MNWLLALASGLISTALFPPFGWVWLAPLSLAPLLVACAREPDWKRRFLLGEIAGFVYWAGVCNWIAWVLENHASMSAVLSWVALLLMCLIKAALWGLFAVLAGAVMRRAWAIPAAAALWTGIERLNAPQGFAWLTLGNAAADMGVPMRLAPFCGVYGVSFLMAMLCAAVAVVWLRRPRSHLVPLAGALATFALPELPPPDAGHESAIAVQTAVPQSESWDRAKVDALVNRLMLLSMGAAMEPAAQRPALLIWPESPAPLYFEADPIFREAARKLPRSTGIPFLFGTVIYQGPAQPRNSALLLGSGGESIARYDKMFLVPFGEYVPPMFSWVNRVTQEAGDFVPGEQVVTPQVDGHRLGPFICYESAFPHLVRQFAAGGAEVLINLTNDGYFGRSSAREQHLILARMRAAENRRWLLRPTNDGFTVSIDPAGRVREKFEPFKRTAGLLRFSWITGQTLYTRAGDWFAWSCLVLGFAAAGVSLFRP